MSRAVRRVRGQPSLWSWMTIVTLYLPIFIMHIVHNRLDIVDQKLLGCIVRAILWQPISFTRNCMPLVTRAQLQGICSPTKNLSMIRIIHYFSLLSFGGFLDNASHMMLLDARSELSIPASRSLFAPSPFLQWPVHHPRDYQIPWDTNATPQRSAKADLLSSLPNTRAPV